MTQLGEMVSIGMVEAKDLECPFHDQHECRAAENNIHEGSGTKLGENLAKGCRTNSTVTRHEEEPNSAYCQPVKEDDPDKAFIEEDREVYLIEGDEDRLYPVGFSAHHLIPGKAAMAAADELHEYIEAGDLVCCDLGYDVNGSENGVWLPGLHAVKGLLWGQADLGSKEEIVERLELTDKFTKWDYAKINGPTATMPDAFDSDNMKWRYVQRAMALRGTRQFHDAHPDYSGRVLEHLSDLAAVLQKFSSATGQDSTCPKAKEHGRSKGGKSTPPVVLLKLLNKSSDWYRKKLVGSTRNDKYYTSSWCGPLAPSRAPKKFGPIG